MLLNSHISETIQLISFKPEKKNLQGHYNLLVDF